MLVPLFKQLAKCLNSSHFQVGFRPRSSCHQLLITRLPCIASLQSVSQIESSVFSPLHHIVDPLTDDAMSHPSPYDLLLHVPCQDRGVNFRATWHCVAGMVHTTLLTALT